MSETPQEFHDEAVRRAQHLDDFPSDGIFNKAQNFAHEHPFVTTAAVLGPMVAVGLANAPHSNENIPQERTAQVVEMSTDEAYTNSIQEAVNAQIDKAAIVGEIHGVDNDELFDTALAKLEALTDPADIENYKNNKAEIDASLQNSINALVSTPEFHAGSTTYVVEFDYRNDGKMEYILSNAPQGFKSIDLHLATDVASDTLPSPELITSQDSGSNPANSSEAAVPPGAPEGYHYEWANYVPQDNGAGAVPNPESWVAGAPQTVFGTDYAPRKVLIKDSPSDTANK